MTQNGGLDLLIAWVIFFALLGILLYFVLRPVRDPYVEAERRTGDRKVGDER